MTRVPRAFWLVFAASFFLLGVKVLGPLLQLDGVATANLPSAAAYPYSIVYDTTAGGPRYSDGVSYQAFGPTSSSTPQFTGVYSTDGGYVTGHLQVNSGPSWLPDAGLSFGFTGSLRRTVSKITIDRSAWTDADGDQTITIGTLPAGMALVGANAVIQTGYHCTGGNPTTSNFLVGTVAQPAYALQVFPAKSAAGTVFGDTNTEAGDCCKNTTNAIYSSPKSYAADTELIIRLTTAGCNVNALTDGGIDLYYVTEGYAQ